MTKNITEIFSLSARLQIDYVYTPFGQVCEDGIIPQPIQWSNEMYDAELGLVYYNYRYYNSRDGRWTRRDDINIEGEVYKYGGNNPCKNVDIYGHYAGVIPLVFVSGVLEVLIVDGLVVGTVYAIVELTQRCPSCPPAQPGGYRKDCVPPSRAHYPCTGSHIHHRHYEMHQNPVTYRCYEKKVEDSIECL